jgi:hypothetical protein
MGDGRKSEHGNVQYQVLNARAGTLAGVLQFAEYERK